MHLHPSLLPATLLLTTLSGHTPWERAEAARAGRLTLQTADRLAADFLRELGGPADACDLTAGLAANATVLALRGDLSLAVASCVNEESATLPKLLDCLEEAFEEFAQGLEELEEVNQERLELCALTGGGPYDPDLDEDAFVEGVDHPYLPFLDGATWVYRKTTAEGLEEVVVTVTGETREVDGIESIVVRDTVTLDGVLVEDTDDWYAQHEDGTVWYMGEISLSYEDGELADLEGSWEAGLDGALPGIVMLARPAVGTTYRQELKLTEAEDAATVLALDATVTIPLGTFTGCLQTEDFTPLEPGHREHKFYAPGIGVVLEVDLETGERLELVSFTPGS